LISVGVLFGGVSSEHRVSIQSSNFIYNILDRRLYRVKPVYIKRTGEWCYGEGWNQDWNLDFTIGFSDLYHEDPDRWILEVEKEFLDRFQAKPVSPFVDPHAGGVDIFVLGLHGGQGEDGTIQAFLDMAGIPYTGSGQLASALAMDKLRSNDLFLRHGIPVAPYFEITRETWEKFDPETSPEFLWSNLNQGRIKFPVFTKPTTGGSSVGTFPAANPADWIQKLRPILQTEEKVLVQERIIGREVSCGVIEIPDGKSWKQESLFPTEIVPNQEFFDFEAKYRSGMSEEITPPEMDPTWIQKIRDLSLLAHRVLGCRGYSRTDFIVTEDGTPWILETNTLPGMTGTSLIPQQAGYSKISMVDLFTWLIQRSLGNPNRPKNRN
jgi:D-alanine-D-alanine ligase